MEQTNPTLKDITFLIGDWNIELSNAAFLPDPNQKSSFSVKYEWKANGSVIAVQQGDAAATPWATWIIGRDEDDSNYTVLYCDDRGVSRVYQMSFKDNIWKMWRNNPKFSQRFEGRVNEDRKIISAYWENSVDGGKTWQHDFDMSYSKIQ